MTHRIGIIGLGVMGERMLRNIGLHPELEVVAAWDPATEVVQRLRREYPAVAVAEGPGALAADPRVACVYIASPPASHLGHADLAFDHDKPVFCEKPLAVDLASAERMLRRVEAEERVAAVNFPFASAPAVAHIAEALGSGALGEIEQITIDVRFAVWPREWQAAAAGWLGERAEGGFVREVVSHFLFAALRLAGPLEILDSRVSYPEDGHSAETAITARLRAGSVPLDLHGQVGGEVPESNAFTVTGSRGAYRLHDWYSLSRRHDEMWVEVDFGVESIRRHTYMLQLDSLTAMLDGREHPLASVREALAVQRCVEGLLDHGDS